MRKVILAVLALLLGSLSLPAQIPYFADLALIYGGGARNPMYWDKERLAGRL